jgi:hypothetical protein
MQDPDDIPLPLSDPDPQTAALAEFLAVSNINGAPLERLMSYDIGALLNFLRRYQRLLDSALAQAETLNDLIAIDIPTKRFLQIHDQITKRSQLLHKIATTSPPEVN